MMDDDYLDDDEEGYGYPDDYEAQYGAGSDDGWDDYSIMPTGCIMCVTDAEELEITQWGFLKRSWSLDCPYCGHHIDGGKSSVGQAVIDWARAGWRVAKKELRRLRVRRAESGGDMGDIPF